MRTSSWVTWWPRGRMNNTAQCLIRSLWNKEKNSLGLRVQGLIFRLWDNAGLNYEKTSKSLTSTKSKNVASDVSHTQSTEIHCNLQAYSFMHLANTQLSGPSVNFSINALEFHDSLRRKHGTFILRWRFFFSFFLILYGFIDRTASEMTGNRTTDRGWYAAKGPRQGLKPRATAGNPLYQLSQQVQLCWFCLQDALTWVNPPQNSSYTLFQLNYLSDLDTYEPYLKTWFSR